MFHHSLIGSVRSTITNKFGWCYIFEMTERVDSSLKKKRKSRVFWIFRLPGWSWLSIARIGRETCSSPRLNYFSRNYLGCVAETKNRVLFYFLVGMCYKQKLSVPFSTVCCSPPPLTRIALHRVLLFFSRILISRSGISFDSALFGKLAQFLVECSSDCVLSFSYFYETIWLEGKWVSEIFEGRDLC